MIDLHCHIIPEVDDGANSMEEAIAMAYMAYDNGVHTICVTPHTNEPVYQNFEDDAYLSKQYMAFVNQLAKCHLPLQLYRGAELFYTEELPNLLKAGKVRSLNQSRFVLVEFPFDIDGEDIDQAILSIQNVGYTPMIAHPERYGCVNNYPELIYQWLQRGALTQLNQTSILGVHGTRVEKTADLLLDHHLVTCIASDAHSTGRRNTNLFDCYNYIAKYYSLDYANYLMEENPHSILSNEMPKVVFQPIHIL